jgi:hypothetical protein
MGVLQASSTQNDLVAAVISLAVIVATIPFLHRSPRWRASDAALLGIAMGAAALVKATAVVAAAPFVVVALARAIVATPRRPRGLAVAVGVAAVVALVPVLPEGVRRARPDLAHSLEATARAYTYQGLAELPDRLLNLGRGIARHVPSPRGLVAAVGIEGWCRPGEELCSGLLLRAHEDNAGNPTHVALVLLAAVVAAVRWRRLPARSALFLGTVPAAWVLFHFAFRDNTWISRLETPTYMLTGLAVVAWASRPATGETPAGGKGKRAHAASAGSPVPFALTAIVTTLALAYSTRVATGNEPRPPLAGEAATVPGYYANQPVTGRVHAVVLSAARQLHCSRIGLSIGGDSYDYPLTWRAMHEGIEVRHVFGEDPWPCLVFSDQRPKPEVVAANRWGATSVPFLFLNGAPAQGGQTAARAP